MKKSAFLTAISIGIMSVSMAFANPAAVAQVRANSMEVMKILSQANGKKYDYGDVKQGRSKICFFP